ncbi:MAG: ATP-binding protein [Candidatus Calescibacterium sp.]|nr:ATP-binding protein [Candidatus Calescibacterium sp.]MDW8195309.1 ATP-binding protein [Candidatus Calescibacterium sp.]
MSDKITAYKMDIKYVKELLFNLTKGKFMLFTKEEFKSKISYLRQKANLSFYFDIRKDEDIYNTRHEVEKIIKDNFQNIDELKVYHILLVFTELSTNIIKHAINGSFEIYIFNEGVYMAFRDSGPGISIDKIPYITLPNYSRLEDSLGFGFNICIELSHSIEMETSSEGTNIIVYMEIC